MVKERVCWKTKAVTETLTIFGSKIGHIGGILVCAANTILIKTH